MMPVQERLACLLAAAVFDLLGPLRPNIPDFFRSFRYSKQANKLIAFVTEEEFDDVLSCRR
jgi:hypothetical protein